MSRKYPEKPLVGVGGVLFDGDAVLLVKRGRPPGKGIWAIPGGLVEVGESLAEAVAREMAEETGLEVEVGPLIDIYERCDRDEAGRPVYHYIIMDYLCRAVGGELAVGSDAAEVGWFTPNELDGLNIFQTARDFIEKARGMAES